MTVLEFEVYYKQQPTHSNPFQLDDDDVEHNLRLLPNDIEHFIPGSKVSTTFEDYVNQRIRIRIETKAPEEEVISEVMRALDLSKLFGKQL